MKSSDKFLIGIVVGIVLLIVAAFAVTLIRREPTYQAEDTPEGVVHNYLLALQKEDYRRAYGYLSPTLKAYPVSVEKFADDVEDHWSFRLDTDTTLAVESSRVTSNRAVVEVRESRFYRGDLFDSSQSTTVFEMEMQLEDGEWKIVDSDYYFVWWWKEPPAPLPVDAPASISLIPDHPTVAQGESISVTIYVANATDLYGVEVHLIHGDGLSAHGVVPGTCAADFVVPMQATDGQIDFAASRTATNPPFSGDCYVAAFTLTGETPGTHVISFDTVILTDRTGAELPVTTRGGRVTVVAPTPQPTATPVAFCPADEVPHVASLPPADQDNT